MPETSAHYHESKGREQGHGFRVEPDRAFPKARPFKETEQHWQKTQSAVEAGLELPGLAEQVLNQEKFAQPTAGQAELYLNLLKSYQDAIKGYENLAKTYGEQKKARAKNLPERASQLIQARSDLGRMINSPEVTAKAGEFARLYLEREMAKHDALWADPKKRHQAGWRFHTLNDFMATLEKMRVTLDAATQQAWEKIKGLHEQADEDEEIATAA